MLTSPKRNMKKENIINMKKKTTEPTSQDLISPEFNAIWEAIKKWDIQRVYGEGYAGATGTDVMIILNALKKRGLKITTLKSEKI